jgi:ElaB/YqjD/DUF883 family membrane-anchored ribosome-binding protein
MANAPSNLKQREDNRTLGAGQFPLETKPHAADSGTGTMDRIRDTASELTDKAKEATSTVTEKAKEMASYVEEKADKATSAIGGGMQSLAGGVERASATVAGKLDSGGRYLQEHDLRGIGADVGNLIRRNPWSAVLISAGIGFLLARVATRS